jgi:hypothetical protein
MPAFEDRTSTGTARKVAKSVASGLSRLGKAASELVDGVVRGLGPAPILQPIPVRVRRQPRR